MTTFVIALRRRKDNWEGALVVNGEIEQGIKSQEEVDEVVQQTLACLEGQPDGQRVTITIQVGKAEAQPLVPAKGRK